MLFSTYATIALAAPGVALSVLSWTGSGLGDWAKGALAAYLALGAVAVAGALVSTIGAGALLALIPAFAVVALGESTAGLAISFALWAGLFAVDRWVGAGDAGLISALFLAAGAIGLARALTVGA